MRTEPFHRNPVAQAAAGAALLLAAAGAAAQEAAAPAGPPDPNPWWIGVRQDLTAETNLFRAPDGQGAARDLVSTTSLLGGLDQPIGRQRLVLDLAAGVNRYKNNTQLDGNTTRAAVRLDWATAGRLSGQASAFQRESLFRYDLDRQQAFTGRTVQRSRGAALLAQLGVVTQWTLEGGLSATDDRYSRTEFQYRDLRQLAGTVGLRWRPHEQTSLRVAARHTDGRYPHYAVDAGGAVLPDEFRRDDLELSLRWTPSDASDLRARVSHTRERHDLQGARDGNGWTGELVYDWTLTGKTGLTLGALRDSSAGASSFDDTLIVHDSSDARRSTRWQARLRWDATSKIRVLAELTHQRRTLDDSFVLTPQLEGGVPLAQGTTARDRLTTASLNLRYQASRGLLFGCALAHERRSTPDNELTFAYRASTAACFGQLQWL
ncbi:MAG: hypothetical protein KF788_12770 [Piscinibacter sp.]|nr:hypothetical protein [Piscinibacter sp.]